MLWRSAYLNRMQYFNVAIGSATAIAVVMLVAIAPPIACQQEQQQNDKLNVLVLYESLCPDSIRFMAEQLRPSYTQLKDYIDITLVPFGKAHSQNNGQHFYCQHGPAECAGNRLQSCVLHQTQDQAAQVKFAICQMLTPNTNSIQLCAESAGLSGDVKQCMQTTLGTALQLQAEKITHTYMPRFIPTIIYDHVFDQRLQDSSIRNFRATVCHLLVQRGTAAPNICQ